MKIAQNGADTIYDGYSPQKIQILWIRSGGRLSNEGSQSDPFMRDFQENPARPGKPGTAWRAREAANLYECTGWVHNEWDGSVSMEIQWEETQIDKVIMSIKNGRYVEIARMEVKQIPVKEERDFRAV